MNETLSYSWQYIAYLWSHTKVSKRFLCIYMCLSIGMQSGFADKLHDITI